MSGMEHRILGWNSFHRVPVLIRDRVETVPAGARLCEPQHSRSRKGFSAHVPYGAEGRGDALAHPISKTRRSLMRKAHVRLTRRAATWLNAGLDEAFATH